MENHGIEMIGPFYLERVDTLPSWSTEYIGRMLYANDEEAGYIGVNGGWDKLSKENVQYAEQANNADKTDGFDALIDPIGSSNVIMVTNSSGKISPGLIDTSQPMSVAEADNADTVDGFDATPSNDPNTIPVRNSDGLISLATLPTSVQDMASSYDAGGYLTIDQIVRTDASTEPTDDATYSIGADDKRYDKIYAVEFNGVATSSKYSDLAERYTFSETPNIGEVVLVSQDESHQCQVSNEQCSDRVLGVVSENPAFRMNDVQLGGFLVARTGIVPCKVQGPCKKSDVLVSDKYAKAIPMKNVENPNYFATKLGHAMENIEEDEVKIINIVL